MSNNLLPLLESPDWIDYLLTDLAIAIATGALLSYLILVFPDPEPLLALPTVLILDPILWVWILLSIILLPFLRWYHVGERAAIWWEKHVE